MSEAATAFHTLCYDDGWVGPDWPEATQLRDDPAALEVATAEQLAGLLTLLVRGEHFCDGTLQEAFDRGLLTGITRRAKVLAGARKPRRALSARDRARGCMLGGAVGDALGADIEFDNLADIRRRFGPAGIRDFVPAYGVMGAITDDTQMALFTAEGLLRSAVRFANDGTCDPVPVVHHAYLRWLKTQCEDLNRPAVEVGMDGWLVGLRKLWARRAPGGTCLSALRASTHLGQPAHNDSKGCGTVMRIAPVGIALPVDHVFDTAAEVSRLTHGHPTAALSAAFFAVLIAEIMKGATLPDAIEAAKRPLLSHPDHTETVRAIEAAQALADGWEASAETVERLGGGWVAEEALAIALYAVLATSSFEDAIILAVNHSGDSDSTGAIAGNIAGALYGVKAIPTRWLKPLELHEEIMAVADDLLALRQGKLDAQNDAVRQRYPGW
jgi:ADP-ribosylglycohydrolase